MTEPRIRVLIADDLASARRGLRGILSLRGSIEVVGEASSGPEAVRLTRRLKPNVVLMDVRMPRGSGLDATRELAGPDVEEPTPVIIMTLFDADDEVLFGAFENGAVGFIPKAAAADELVDAVQQAAAGHAMISTTVTRRVIAEFARRRAARGLARPARNEPPAQLTPREADVVRALCQGLTDGEIAAELHIEKSTVKSYLVQVRVKTGSKNRTAIMRWALDSGLIPPNNWPQ